MIQDITINRNLVYTNSICINNNGTISINLGTSLLTLEPKLPNFFKTLFKSNDQDQIQLLTKELYNQQMVVDGEMLDKWNIRRFNKINLSDSSTDFYFTRVEALIVKHLWSSISPESKTCSLFILLNTGELVIMNQNNTVTNFFLILNGGSVFDDNGPEIYMTNDQFKSYKIKDFEVIDNGVAILTDANVIEIFRRSGHQAWYQENTYQIDDEIINFKSIDKDIIYITSSNEVCILKNGVTNTIMPPSRFKVNYVKCVDSKVYIGNVNSITIYDTNSETTGSVELPTNSMINNIIVSGEDLIISYESGIFSPNLGIQYSLNKFVKLVKLKSPGALVIHGAEYHHGVLVVVYKVVPENSINYTILSKQEFQLGFIVIDGSSTITDFPSGLSFINSLWFKKFDQFSIFSETTVFTDVVIRKFIHSLQSIKTDLGIDTFQEIELPYDNSELSETVAVNLDETYTLNATVKKYQAAYNLNEIYIGALKTLNTKLSKIEVSKETLEIANSYYESLLAQQSSIEFILQTFIIKLMLRLEQGVHTDIDHYMMDQFKLFLGLPHAKSSVTLSTDFVTETFITGSSFEPLAKSESGHQWSRCQLTLVPLTGLETNSDRFGKFNYLIQEPYEGLSGSLVNNLGYCIVSGNAFK